MRYLILLTLLSACTSPDPPDAIPRDVACDEQAEAWCDGSGDARLDTHACRQWIRYECGGPDWAGSVEEDDQIACLESMADASTAVPEACLLTWSER